MARAVPLILAIVVVGSFVAGCASSGTKRREPQVPVRVTCAAQVPRRDLLAAAELELSAFQKQGRRAADVDDAAYAMTRYLKRQGYAHARVDALMEPSPDAIAQVTFAVTEGPLASWGNVSVPGAESFSRARVERFFVFVRRKSAFLEKKEEPAPFTEVDLKTGIAALEAFYLIEGFYRVKVGPPAITWRGDDVVADVTIPVTEGRRYVVTDVVIESDVPVERQSRLEARARSFHGAPYHARVPILIDSAMRTELAAEGRLLARSETEASIDDSAGAVVLRSRIQPGPRVRIANLEVEGNERTRRQFILDQARIEAGAILTGKDLEDATGRLYGTGIFKSVRIHTPDSRPAGSESELDAQVRIAVEEIEARSVDFGLGYGSYELLRGSVRYRDRNLFGLGRQLELEPAVSLKSVGADLRFFDDYLLGERNTLEILSGFLFREEPSFDSTSYRVEAAVRRRVSSRLMLRGGYRLIASDATDIEVDDPEDQESSIEAGPFADLEYDTRDNPVLPTRGIFANAGTSLSAPLLGANLAFLEVRGGISGYVPLAEDTVVAGSLRFRTREILDDRDTLPIQNRLFLGGAQSVRSFGEDELGPTDSDGDPLGGLTVWEATVELRQRLIGDLHGAVFGDAGSVGEHGFDFSAPRGYAIGLGLRYYLPMGPVRLDFALNPGRRFASDADYAVHFSFGFSF